MYRGNKYYGTYTDHDLYYETYTDHDLYYETQEDIKLIGKTHSHLGQLANALNEKTDIVNEADEFITLNKIEEGTAPILEKMNEITKFIASKKDAISQTEQVVLDRVNALQKEYQKTVANKRKVLVENLTRPPILGEQGAMFYRRNQTLFANTGQSARKKEEAKQRLKKVGDWRKPKTDIAYRRAYEQNRPHEFNILFPYVPASEVNAQQRNQEKKYFCSNKQVLMARKKAKAGDTKMLANKKKALLLLKKKDENEVPSVAVALRRACAWGTCNALNALLPFASIEDINSQTLQTKLTALHYAVNKGCIRSVRVMLYYGANTRLQCGNNGFTPLHYAVAQGKPEVVNLLASCGVGLEIKDKEGRTPKELAIAMKKQAIVKDLEAFENLLQPQKSCQP